MKCNLTDDIIEYPASSHDPVGVCMIGEVPMQVSRLCRIQTEVYVDGKQWMNPMVILFQFLPTL